MQLEFQSLLFPPVVEFQMPCRLGGLPRNGDMSRSLMTLPTPPFGMQGVMVCFHVPFIFTSDLSSLELGIWKRKEEMAGCDFHNRLSIRSFVLEVIVFLAKPNWLEMPFLCLNSSSQWGICINLHKYFTWFHRFLPFCCCYCYKTK